MSDVATRFQGESRRGKRKEREEDEWEEGDHANDVKRRAYACLAVVADGWKELPRMKPIVRHVKPTKKGWRKRARIGKPKISFAFRFQTNFQSGDEGLPELQRTVKESETEPTGRVQPHTNTRQGSSAGWSLAGVQGEKRTSEGSGLLGEALKEFQGEGNKPSFITGAIDEARKGSRPGTSPKPEINPEAAQKQSTDVPSAPAFQFGKENSSTPNQGFSQGPPQQSMFASPGQAGAAAGPASGSTFHQALPFGASAQGTTGEPQMKFSLGGAPPVPGRRVVRARRRPR